MVVCFLFVTCILKLAACNPYLPSISATKFPASIPFSPKISPGVSTNQIPDFSLYNSYNYNVPQKTTQPVEEVKLGNLNKDSAPLAIALPSASEPYLPDRRLNALAPGKTKFVRNTDLDDSAIPKVNNDSPTPKHQHNPFSKTFNNFRENLLKTMDLDLKSKAPPTSASGTVKTVDKETIKQAPKLQTTQANPKDTFPKFAITNDIMFKQQQNEGSEGNGVKEEISMPVDAAKFKYYTTSEKGASENRTPYSNNIKPFIQISKNNTFDSIYPNIQTKQNFYENLPRNVSLDKYISQMQPLSTHPFLSQENLLVVPNSAPLNESLVVSDKGEKKMSQAFREPSYKKLNPFNSLPLNQQLLPYNQTLEEESKLKMDPNNSIQWRSSRMPFYNSNNNMLNAKLLTQPGNQSVTEDSLLKMHQNYLTYQNTSNILPNNNDKDKSVSLMQLRTNRNNNASVFVNSELIRQPAQVLHSEEANVQQIFRSPYFNNFNQPYTRAFSEQLIPKSQLIAETVDPKYTPVEKNESKMPQLNVTPSILYEYPVEVAASRPAPLYEESVIPIYKAPYNSNENLLNSKQLNTSYNQLQENQFVKTEPLSPTPSDVSNILQNKNVVLSMTQASALPTEPQENPPEVTISKVKNQHSPVLYEEKSELQILRDSYFSHVDPVNSRTKENEFVKTAQHTPHEIKINDSVPNNYSDNRNVSDIQSLSVSPTPSVHQNTLLFTDLGIVNQSASTVTKNIVDASYTQPLSELPDHKENFSEYVQLIDDTENMRTKNEIAMPHYYPKPKNKGTKPDTYNNVFENKFQTNPYYNMFNPLYSRGFNQQNMAKNTNLPKTNDDVLSQENKYSDPTYRSDSQMPLSIPQPSYNKYLKSSPDNTNITSDVAKHSGTTPSKDVNSSPTKKDNIHGYESQPTRVPYYNNFDPSYAFNQQSLHNQMVKDNQIAKTDQRIMPQDLNNVITPDIHANTIEPQISQLQQKPSTLPMRYINIDPENSTLESKASKPLNIPDHKNLQSSQVNRAQNETQSNKISTPHNIHFYSLNTNALNQQLSHENQTAKDDQSNKLIKTNQITLPNMDININIPNSDNCNKNTPIEITIIEKLFGSCSEKNDSKSPNIDFNNANAKHYNTSEKPCKSVEPIQQCNEMSTEIDVIMPSFTLNNNTNSTESSKLNDITIPSVDLNDFSSYLADSILSAVQSFIKQSDSSNANLCITEKNSNDTDENNSSCKCSNLTLSLPELENSLNNMSVPSNKNNESEILLQNIQEEILSTNSTKEQSPGKSDTERNTKDLSREIVNEIPKHYAPLNVTGVNGRPSNQHNKTLPKDSYIDSNEAPKKPTDDKFSNTLNPNDKVLETNDKVLPTEAHQALQPSNVDKNESTTSNQTSKIFLPYYYYIDRINTTSNDTKQTVPKPNATSATEEEVEENSAISQDTSSIHTVIDNNHPEVRRPCGPKPCLSKITVNILPVAEKNNHDKIILFI